MNWKKHFAEAATLIGAAVICALVSNAVASRERKVALVTVPASAPRVSEQRPTEVGPPPSTPTTPPLTTAAPVVQPQPVPAPRTTTVNRQPTTPPKAAVKKEFKPHPDKAYIEIRYDDVDALYKSGALFLDARRTSVYEQGHIAGARPFSVWESDIDDKVNRLFAERSDPRDQEKPIVAYCSGGDCEDSHMLAQKLWGIQINNVYVYKDGFPDWQSHGGPIHTGATP